MGIESIERALGGDRRAVRRFVDELTPVIHARVARILLHRRPAASGRDIRQEVEDLAQEIFLLLFARDGRVLRSWEPKRGLSLANFVGLIAERQTISRFRRARSNPWTEEPSELETLPDDEHGESALGENRAIARDLLQTLVDRLRLELTPLGLRVFVLLYLEQRSVDEVCETLDMTADGVYAWRSRLRKRVRRMAAEIDSEAMSESPPARRRPYGGH